MKKILLLATAMFTMTVASNAAQMVISCVQTSIGSNLNFVAAGNTSTLSCPGFGVLEANLGTINGIAFVQSTDYNVAVDPFNPGNPASLAINYTLAVPGTAFDALVTNRDFTRGSTTNPLIQITGVPPASYGDYVNNFLIGVTINSVTNVAGATVQQAIFDGAFLVDYTLPTNETVPEPSTIAFIGAGLVALATAARRRS
ncbi:MAG: PEP-CTERM sorting domain-containing protein [Acidobacteria bacterium]|nr:PEP-CTERM sorting domain-containing protein [Acidobacteriota bacterium]